MARICSSNWLAGQASIVQWPELCGRGASSLTSTLPRGIDEHLHREQADQVERLRHAAGDVLRLPGPPPPGCGRARGSGPGCGSRWRFSTVSNAAMAPSAPRAITTLISWAKSMKPSRISGFGASRSNAGARSSGAAQHRLALAVIAQARGLQHRAAGRAAATAARSSSRLCTGQPGRGGDTGAVEERLLGDPVLADAQDVGRRAHRLHARPAVPAPRR